MSGLHTPRAGALRRSPLEGGTPPSEPPFASRPPATTIGGNRSSTFYHVAFVVMAEGVGFEPTVP